MKKIVIFLIFLFVSLVSFSSMDIPLKVGDKVPDFKYYTLEGKELNSKDLLGKKILLNFSSTWCPQCIKEKEKLNKEYSSIIKNDSNLNFLIFFGPYGRRIERRDTAEVAKNYMTSKNYIFPSYFDKNREVIEIFGVKSIPTSFLIDEKGIIVEINNEYYKTLNLPTTK